MATRKFKITFVACLVFLLGSAGLDSASKHLKTISNTKCNVHKIKMGVESMEEVVFSNHHFQ